ncbi:hypothetical protein JC525_09075 [Alteromonas sp. IB21]|uniref:hypothetical protein n=1 Tax=Alteromonas sp. IB21 TaxID=2779369 RepID=UPI0018E90349|nr:hypothetical protein [Alteromonas sp. IB21]MBJ2129088.1 hypothetical protein [Alteromonas sp. IB21]
MGSQAENVYQFKGRKPMGEGNGFVLMYQSIDTQPWSNDPFCMLVAPFLIRKAAYSAHERQYGKHIIQLEIGQYVTTLLNLAKSSALYGFYTKSKNPDEAAKSAVKRVLKILSEDGFLECKTIGKGKDQCTVITLKNWANYQAKNVSVLKPIREPLEKPIETQAGQGVEQDSKPNPEPKPSPNTNKGYKQQIKDNADPEALRIEKINEVRVKGFEHFWESWRESKKAIGVNQKPPKTHTYQKNFMKAFPDSYMKKIGHKGFIKEINDMLNLMSEAFSDIESCQAQGKRSDFENYVSMFPALFLTRKQWREEA